MANRDDMPMKHLMDALQYLAAVTSSLGGPQSSLRALDSAKYTVEYWLCMVIDERIEQHEKKN